MIARASCWLLVSLVVLGVVPQAAAQFVEKPVILTDDADRTVHLRRPARRVVAMEPFLAELLFDVGAGKTLVAVGGESSYPAEVLALPKVTPAVANFIAEQIPLLRPDLVVVWAESVQPYEVERIAAAGPAVFVAQVRTIPDAARVMKSLAKLTGQDASSVVEGYARRVESLYEVYGRRAPVRALIELRHRPFVTVSGRHFLSEALEVCGAENVFATQAAMLPEPYWDQVERRNPWVIIGVGSASNEDEFRKNWALRRSLSAVQADRLAFIQTDVTQQPTLRTLADVARICEAIDRFRPKS